MRPFDLPMSPVGSALGCAVGLLCSLPSIFPSEATASIPFRWERTTDVSFSGEGCARLYSEQVVVGKAAYNVVVTGIAVGDVLADEDGYDVATVREIRLATRRDQRVYVEIAVQGTGLCPPTPTSQEVEWETEEVSVKVDFSQRSRVFFNAFYAEGDEKWTRERPRWIKCGSDCGWTDLRWSRWGGQIAKARGNYRWVEKSQGPYVERKYPVQVTLSRPKACYGNLRYLRMSTRFLGSRPPGTRSSFIAKNLSCSRGIF